MTNITNNTTGQSIGDIFTYTSGTSTLWPPTPSVDVETFMRAMLLVLTEEQVLEMISIYPSTIKLIDKPTEEMKEMVKIAEL